MIQVAAAIIENDKGQILIAKRKAGNANGGLWEFPGGKLEPGESVEECLKRELQEEMTIEIDPYKPFAVNEYTDGETTIRLYGHRAKYAGGDIVLLDHEEVRWVDRDELDASMFAPADVRFVELLMEGR